MWVVALDSSKLSPLLVKNGVCIGVNQRKKGYIFVCIDAYEYSERDRRKF